MAVERPGVARALAALLVGLSVTTPAAGGSLDAGAVGAPPRDGPNTIRAAFGARSYAPGDRALLRVTASVSTASLQIYRAGPERRRPVGPEEMLGVPVTKPRTIHLDGGRPVGVRIGDWESGFYFARLEAAGGWLGFAPVVVRPKILGTERVAVVLPTNTWQAYNFRDVDGNGVGDTWYANPRIPCVDLSRPYLDRGVPSMVIRGFMRWFEHGDRRADFLADDDLGAIESGDELARLYDLVVFASHEEYVTEHAYDVVERFRDLGGNLAFLSANTFFYRVDRRGDRMCRTGL